MRLNSVFPSVNYLLALVCILLILLVSIRNRSQFPISLTSAPAPTPQSDKLTTISAAKDCGWLTATMLGRLGSQMYIYSSLYGLGKHNNKRPFIPSGGSEVLRETFESLSIPVIEWNFAKFPFNGVRPKGYSIFSQGLMELQCDQNVNIYMEPHSYKYFDKYWTEIRKEFKFKKAILDPCQQSIREAVGDKKSCTIIGVHLRRGDFAQPDKTDFGHQPARDDLLNKGIEYFHKKLGSTQCLVFLILGNDHKWNLEHAPKASNVVVMQPQSASIDFCILANSNHSIVSTGTFGIMAGLLANGITLYQREQTRPNSSLDALTKVEDLIPEGWIAI